MSAPRAPMVLLVNASQAYRPLTRLPPLASLTFVLAGCPETITDPDGDDTRGAAKPVEVGQVVTDTVDPPEDTVDWKIIQIPSGGYLTVNVFWDEPGILGFVQ